LATLPRPDLDDHKMVVDGLVEMLQPNTAMKRFYQETQQDHKRLRKRTIIHRLFLSECDPKLLKTRGVWYTPAPVLNFIVQTVDDIYKTNLIYLQGTYQTTIK
jgi:hypothetical protein